MDSKEHSRAKLKAILHDTHVWWSLGIAIAILCLCYLFNNIAYSPLLSTTKYSILEPFYRATHNTSADLEDAVFVNVSYDKMLITDTVEVPDTNRKRAVTDRKRLLDFLKKVENTNYRYLFIDIRFEQNECSHYDSALTEQLLKMRDVAIAKHWDMGSNHPYPMTDSRMEPLGFYCDFDDSRSNAGFYKYRYLQNGGNSIALEMYRHETARSITRHGSLYFDGCKLCQNARFLTIHTSMENECQDDYEQNYWHLPELLFDSLCWNSFRDDVSGKYLIVGDMKEDMHDTYAHAQPGAYLHYLGFKSLTNGKHIVRWWYVLLLLLVYFFISYTTLQGLRKENTRWHPLQWIAQRPLLHFLCSLLGYTFILSLLSTLLYLLFDIAYNVMIPSFCFALISHYVQFKRMRKNA